MLIRDKYCRPWSDAAHYARHLTRAYDICPSIRQVFIVDITYRHFQNYPPLYWDTLYYRYSALLNISQMLTFLLLNRFLSFDYSLESSRRENSNELSQHRFQLRLKEISQKMFSECIVICISGYLSILTTKTASEAIKINRKKLTNFISLQTLQSLPKSHLFDLHAEKMLLNSGYLARIMSGHERSVSGEFVAQQPKWTPPFI